LNKRQDLFSNGDDNDDDDDDTTTKVVYKKHGEEQVLKVNISLWEDQTQCYWGLRSLLNASGSQKMLTVGDTILTNLIPIYEKMVIEIGSPLMSSLCATIGACMRHMSVQVVTGVRPNTQEVLADFYQKATLLLGPAYKQLQDEGEKHQKDEDAEDLMFGNALRGPMDLLDSIFRALFNFKESGLILPDNQLTELIGNAFEKVIVPGVHLWKQYRTSSWRAELPIIDELGDIFFEEEFILELSNLLQNMLKCSGDTVFALMRSCQVDLIFPERVADDTIEMHDKMNSVTTIAGMLNYGGEAATAAYAKLFVPVVSSICKADFSKEIEAASDPHEDIPIRSAATYGISVLFDKSFNVLSDAEKTELLGALQFAAIDHKDAKHVQRRNVLENAIIAYVYFHFNKGDTAEVVAKYFEALPVHADIEDMERLTDFFLRLMKENHPWTASPLLQPYIASQIRKCHEFRSEMDNPRLCREVQEALSTFNA